LLGRSLGRLYARGLGHRVAVPVGGGRGETARPRISRLCRVKRMCRPSSCCRRNPEMPPHRGRAASIQKSPGFALGRGGGQIRSSPERQAVPAVLDLDHFDGGLCVGEVRSFAYCHRLVACATIPANDAVYADRCLSFAMPPDSSRVRHPGAGGNPGFQGHPPPPGFPAHSSGEGGLWIVDTGPLRNGRATLPFPDSLEPTAESPLPISRDCFRNSR